VLENGGNGVVCLKPTTDKGKYYDKRPELVPGCVIYEEGVAAVFTQRTIIDTHRTYHVPHKVIARDFTEDQTRLRGHMPDDFHYRLVQAIRRSPRISFKRKRQLLAMIGATP